MITTAVERFENKTQENNAVRYGIPITAAMATWVVTSTVLTTTHTLVIFPAIIVGSGTGMLAGIAMGACVFNCYTRAARSTGETVPLPSASIRVNYGDE